MSVWNNAWFETKSDALVLASTLAMVGKYMVNVNPAKNGNGTSVSWVESPKPGLFVRDTPFESKPKSATADTASPVNVQGSEPIEPF